MSGYRFFGERLTEAREAMAMSKVSLAERIGVTPQAIGHWENNKREPERSNVDRLAMALGQKPVFFFVPPLKDEVQRVFWRKRRAETKKMRAATEQKNRWVGELFGFLSTEYEVFSQLPPRLDLPRNVLEISLDDVENYAVEIRYQLGLGLDPIENMTNIIENIGIPVIFLPNGPDKQDAFTWWSATNRRKFIGVNLKDASACKVRFSLAHELWHVIAHGAVTDDQLDDEDFLTAIEKQADRFAGALLFPGEMFAKEIRRVSLDDFAYAKLRWKVEIASMVMRSYQLGFIDRDRQTDLFRKMAQRKWRGAGRNEPYDDSIEYERPGIMNGLFNAFISENPEAIRVFRNRFPHSPKHMEQFLGLEDGAIERRMASSSSVFEIEKR